jgi:rhodanese-related sulfurtransferase
MSVEAVNVLRKAGFKAVRMEDGVADWRQRNWHVETGAESA